MLSKHIQMFTPGLLTLLRLNRSSFRIVEDVKWKKSYSVRLLVFQTGKLISFTSTHSPLPLTNLPPPLHFPLLRYPLPLLHLLCARLRHTQALALCLSQHRHLFTSSSLALAFSAIMKNRCFWFFRTPRVSIPRGTMPLTLLTEK